MELFVGLLFVTTGAFAALIGLLGTAMIIKGDQSTTLSTVVLIAAAFALGVGALVFGLSIVF